MVKRTFSVPIMQTRVGTVTAIMVIDALSDAHAEALRDEMYDTIDRVRRIFQPLQHITGSEQSLGVSND